MVNCGIIAEYNPFHNGHLYHIQKTREKFKDSNIICVMSGNFTQRGEVAIIDKWKRASCAIHCGADLVLELPDIYSTQSANRFARSSINILNGLNIIDYLSFGCETDDIDLLQNASKISNSNEYKLELKKALKNGNTFAKATSVALNHFGISYDITSQPNSILALEYLCAIEKSNIKPMLIQRTNNHHNDLILHDNITSATSIRTALKENNSIKNVVPEFVQNVIKNSTFNSLENYFNILRYKILCLGIEGLKEIHDITEGLENRIYKSALVSNSLEELIMNIKSKRYLYTRIQRILVYILLDIKKSIMQTIDDNNLPVYARILAINKNKPELLSDIKKNATIPIVSKAADYKSILSPMMQEIFEYSLLATKIYSLYSDISPTQDFTAQIIKQM